ncbi:MAG: 6,7-dimethyl-8-ribityllumazine synthase [bacterium]|nr:6,7-dimethyl-8-ribityllumazine synthase [bacterium]
MANIMEGHLNAKGLKVALVVSRFNEFLVSKLVDGAKDCLIRHAASAKNITEIRVPGGFELPYAAKLAADSGKFDAVICLGAVIRGGTPHFEYIASETAKGIAMVGLDSGVPTIFGVLTTDTLEQAIERSGTKSGNKGWEAALTAIEMVDLAGKLKG